MFFDLRLALKILEEPRCSVQRISLRPNCFEALGLESTQCTANISDKDLLRSYFRQLQNLWNRFLSLACWASWNLELLSVCLWTTILVRASPSRFSEFKAHQRVRDWYHDFRKKLEIWKSKIASGLVKCSDSADQCNVDVSANKLCFCIGISSYSNQGKWNALPNAAADAVKVSRAFASLGYTCHTVAQDVVNDKDFQHEYDQLLSAVNQETQVVVLYFAGHGTEINSKLHLCFSDASCGHPSAGMLAVEELTKPILNMRTPAPNQSLALISMFDCCRDDLGAIETHSGYRSLRGRTRQYGEIRSCLSGRQASDAFGASSSGPFAHALCHYLYQNQAYTLKELYEHVGSSVMRNTRNRQMCELKCESTELSLRFDLFVTDEKFDTLLSSMEDADSIERDLNGKPDCGEVAGIEDRVALRQKVAVQMCGNTARSSKQVAEMRENPAKSFKHHASVPNRLINVEHPPEPLPVIARGALVFALLSLLILGCTCLWLCDERQRLQHRVLVLEEENMRLRGHAVLECLKTMCGAFKSPQPFATAAFVVAFASLQTVLVGKCIWLRKRSRELTLDLWEERYNCKWMETKAFELRQKLDQQILDCNSWKTRVHQLELSLDKQNAKLRGVECDLERKETEVSQLEQSLSSMERFDGATVVAAAGAGVVGGVVGAIGAGFVGAAAVWGSIWGAAAARSSSPDRRR